MQRRLPATHLGTRLMQVLVPMTMVFKLVHDRTLISKDWFLKVTLFSKTVAVSLVCLVNQCNLQDTTPKSTSRFNLIFSCEENSQITYDKHNIDRNSVLWDYLHQIRSRIQSELSLDNINTAHWMNLLFSLAQTYERV